MAAPGRIHRAQRHRGRIVALLMILAVGLAVPGRIELPFCFCALTSGCGAMAEAGSAATAAPMPAMQRSCCSSRAVAAATAPASRDRSAPAVVARAARCGCTLDVGADQPTRAVQSAVAVPAPTYTLACELSDESPRPVANELRSATHPPWPAPPASLARRPLRC